MFTDEAIGKWAIRRKARAPTRYRGELTSVFSTAAHLIDSIVADDIVTACGKHMTLNNRQGWLELGVDVPACMTCQGIRDRRMRAHRV